MTAKPYFVPLGFDIDKLLLWGVFVLLCTLMPVSHVAAQTCTPPPPAGPEPAAPGGNIQEQQLCANKAGEVRRRARCLESEFRVEPTELLLCTTELGDISVRAHTCREPTEPLDLISLMKENPFKSDAELQEIQTQIEALMGSAAGFPCGRGQSWCRNQCCWCALSTVFIRACYNCFVTCPRYSEDDFPF